jgi:predicted Zn-dependent protease with MMP-like domain/Flp pilus assembly protein TadD
MNPFDAHLERGWDLVERGDFEGAKKSVERLLKLDGDAPEGHVLLGVIKNGLGDPEGAVEAFEAALERDPEQVEAMLYAAETYLAALDDHERALELCEQALERVDDAAQRSELLLLKADAELFAEREDDARATLSELPTPLGDPELELHAGRLWSDLGEPPLANEHLRRVLAADPPAALASDAWHALGLLAEERGDFAGTVEAFGKVRELDRTEERASWATSEAEFERIAEQALAELPERVRELLANVPILVSDYPSAEIVSEGNDPRMMGFFSGLPWPHKHSVGGSTPQLDCILLFQRNIERHSRTRAEMADEIRTTLLHETGHFFGLSDEDLEEIGLG